MNWKKISENGLPEVGVYLFKNEETHEIKQVMVSEYNGHKSWSTNKQPFSIATHWCKIPD